MEPKFTRKPEDYVVLKDEKTFSLRADFGKGNPLKPMNFRTWPRNFETVPSMRVGRRPKRKASFKWYTTWRTSPI